MLSSPVRRGGPVAAFCAGLIVGGVLSAAVLLVVGSLLRVPVPVPVRWLVVAATLGLTLLVERGVLDLRLPENRRLVPESVFRLGRYLGPLQFGVEMGSGVRTYLPSVLPYPAAVAVLLLASPAAALCAGVGFGLGRSLMTVSHLRYGPDGAWDLEWLRHGRRLALATGAAFLACLLVLALTVR